jgi:hypothetical protein
VVNRDSLEKTLEELRMNIMFEGGDYVLYLVVALSLVATRARAWELNHLEDPRGCRMPLRVDKRIHELTTNRVESGKLCALKTCVPRLWLPCQEETEYWEFGSAKRTTQLGVEKKIVDAYCRGIMT